VVQGSTGKVVLMRVVEIGALGCRGDIVGGRLKASRAPNGAASGHSEAGVILEAAHLNLSAYLSP
jgi:hypothetical protein